jgi:hypothetical protein
LGRKDGKLVDDGDGGDKIQDWVVMNREWWMGGRQSGKEQNEGANQQPNEAGSCVWPLGDSRALAFLLNLLIELNSSWFLSILDVFVHDVLGCVHESLQDAVDVGPPVCCSALCLHRYHLISWMPLLKLIHQPKSSILTRPASLMIKCPALHLYSLPTLKRAGAMYNVVNV